MLNRIPVTESDSEYRHLEQMSTGQLLEAINHEDQKVPQAVAKALPQIELLVKAVLEKMEKGGRLFYIGAGTSGRLGMVDASECPPTFGVDAGRVIGIMAGGQEAMFKAIEFAEDNLQTGWQDLEQHKISSLDFVVGISASGTTPYVLSALKACSLHGISTGCIVSNPGSPIAGVASCPVEVITGPEFVTGSTRMKSGTAQKLVLNMLSNSVMIGLGLVEDNKMVNMQLANDKLVNRGVQMVMQATGLTNPGEAKNLLIEEGSVRKAVEKFRGRLV
jgi:N-acetylmuramic acid 6-phosphate etherase